MPDLSSDQPAQDPSPKIYSQPLPPPESFRAPTHQSKSPVVKAVLITVAIFVGLGVIGAGILGFGAWYLAKSVHSVPSATFTEADLGIAIYPGAEPSLRGSRMELAGKTMLSATYITTDSAEKVIAFYNEKAGPSAHLITTSYGSEFRLSKAPGDFTTVKVMRVPDGSGGKTYITINRAHY
jgi:hypothetical protein